MWAANKIWNGIEKNIGVDLSEDMLAVAERMSKGSMKGFMGRRFLPNTESGEKADLVISSFTLGDLTSDAIRSQTIQNLWSHTTDILVLIDRGTPEGFKRITQARSMILDTQDTHIIAPCPHTHSCPMLTTKSWCHFSQRTHRTKHMLQTKTCTTNHEDIKFSYIVFRRGPPPSFSPSSDSKSLPYESLAWPRLIAPPMKRSKHVIMDWCASSGRLERGNITKGKDGKEVYYEARKSHWGDVWPYKFERTVVVRDGLGQGDKLDKGTEEKKDERKAG